VPYPQLLWQLRKKLNFSFALHPALTAADMSTPHSAGFVRFEFELFTKPPDFSLESG